MTKQKRVEPLSTLTTKEQILNAAEELFAVQGYSGTSIRAVIRKAGVNLAAINYHFGSKEELYVAVIRQVAGPVVNESLQRFKALEDLDRAPTVEEILEAAIAPSFRVIQKQNDRGLIHTRFMGRCRIEPFPVQQLADQEFSRITQSALELLQKTLPEQSFEELEWKFDLVIAALLRTLDQTEQTPPEEVDLIIQRLVRFTTHGFSA
ncbi:MAG: TetR/AcrR family transcriptional regulator [Synechococcaceae cyanobacterium SM2_3_1]|nr:TetR/AcrR family transcriptional regulator [Synechococcaceae cyanobacterium SM2_3_1]